MLKVRRNIIPITAVHAVGRLVCEALEGTPQNRMPPHHRLTVSHWLRA